ncbi:MAG: ribonuclease III [Chloroflexi bacterium]|nr:MAG: ribonuclease III [Chloroflexota bacterium]
MDKLTPLQERLQIQNTGLLTRALTHRSYLNEHPEETEDNERLEFLGDAVLDFVVGDYLFHRFPEMDEGELTSLRAALVRAQTLAAFAREWDLGQYLRLGVGEAEQGGRERVPTLCATFEAVIGAVYLDRGLAQVRQLVEPMIEPALDRIMRQALHKDAKSEFQVWAQARFNVTPRYRVVATAGPDHAKEFTVQVLIGEKVWGQGVGRSKQAAAQMAAREALERVRVLGE